MVTGGCPAISYAPSHDPAVGVHRLMPRILAQPFAVPADAIDLNGHVNNLAYLGWMQEVAIRHSTLQGWPVERYLEAGCVWVVRSHFIEYLAPAFQDQSLTLLTWVTGYRQHSSPRRYLFFRPTDRQVIARAETLWVFVDARSGRPRRIPADLRNAFEVVPEDEDVLRTLTPPPGGTDTSDSIDAGDPSPGA
jgi:acyl-CoA thioester hydrolase